MQAPVDDTHAGRRVVARAGDAEERRATEAEGRHPDERHPAHAPHPGHQGLVALRLPDADVVVDAEPRERVDARDPEDGAEVGLDVAELLAERPAVDDGRDQGEGRDEDADRQIGDRQRRQEVGIDAGQHLRPEEDEQDEHVADNDRQHQQQDDARLYGERHCARFSRCHASLEDGTRVTPTPLHLLASLVVVVYTHTPNYVG